MHLHFKFKDILIDIFLVSYHLRYTYDCLDHKKEILDHKISVLCTFGTSMNDKEMDLTSLYLIPKLYSRCSYNINYISNQNLASMFFNTIYSRGGVK